LKASTSYRQPQQERCTKVRSHARIPSNYYDQTWYKGGLQTPRGQCAWAATYKDDASAEPRTNCAMDIQKNGAAYGVLTIDVTLGCQPNAPTKTLTVRGSWWAKRPAA
jgi:hypothetical protein